MIAQSQRLTTDPRDPGFYQDPYKTYARCRSFPLFFWEHYGMWCVPSFAQVNAILRDRRFGRVMPGTQSAASPHLHHFNQVERFSLLNLEPPQHTRLRSLVNHAFIARQINTLRPEIEALATQRLAIIRDSGTSNLLDTYAMPVPATIIARMLGVPERYVPRLLQWSHAMVKVYTLAQSRQDEYAADRAAAEFSTLLRELIVQRRRSPGPELLSHLIAARLDGESLSDDELISTTVLLLNAGHEATVHQTGNAIKTILESCLDPALLFDTPEQTSRTITELMRYDAPLHIFTRFALVDVTLDTVDLKAGDQIALLLGAANRDPERFREPDKFDPWRTDGGHVSLGAGVHYCVGASLAKVELEILVPLVFSELPGLTLAGSPRYKDAFHFHGLERLDVSWDVA